MRSHGSARTRGNGPRYSKCKGCGQMVSAGSMVYGECPDCAGLAPLPLRGSNGRFLTFKAGDDVDAAGYLAKYAAKVADGIEVAEGGEVQ